MKMTSAYANKMLKQLDDEKAYLLTMEKSSIRKENTDRLKKLSRKCGRICGVNGKPE